MTRLSGIGGLIPGKNKIFLFFKASIPPLGSSQILLMGTGFSSLGVKWQMSENDRSQSDAEFKRRMDLGTPPPFHLCRYAVRRLSFIVPDVLWKRVRR